MTYTVISTFFTDYCHATLQTFVSAIAHCIPLTGSDRLRWRLQQQYCACTNSCTCTYSSACARAYPGSDTCSNSNSNSGTRASSGTNTCTRSHARTKHK